MKQLFHLMSLFLAIVANPVFFDQLQHLQAAHLGVVVDSTSQSGKEEKIAIEMAVEDFCAQSAPCPILHVTNSRGDPARAADLAKNLIQKHKVKAIIGFETWQETAFVADLSNKSEVAILSLANEIPKWATTHWPFLVNAARSQLNQFQAVAAIIRSWKWRRVNIIYEDNISPTASDITYLISSIHQVNSEIANLSPLPLFPQIYNLSQKLERLKHTQCRVFIVHSSLPLAIKIFTAAKKLGMMKKGFVWIITTSVSNQIDSLSASTIAQMQGVLGVKSYYSRSGKRFRGFQFKFRKKFRLKYPKQLYSEPSFTALQAFDAASAAIRALEAASWKSHENRTELTGKELLNRVLQSDFEGFAGLFKLKEGLMDRAKVFEIINVVGKGSRELGYWSEGLGFSKSIGGGERYNESMRFLGNVIWAGDAPSPPRGWASVTAVKRLKIGVPANATFSEFVKVTYKNQTNKPIVSGFSIDVFKTIVEGLPYDLPCKFIPYHGAYDSLVEQVSLQKFDAVVGDTAITSQRYQHVEFSQPYTEWGVQILILNKKQEFNKALLFVMPFKPVTWFVILLINIYNGAVVYLIEISEADRNHLRQLPFWREFITIFLKAFTVLFSVHGEQKKDLSRFVLVGWLFFALIITSSYTAMLSSLLTSERLGSTKIDIYNLQKTGVIVGCSGRSFVYNYLVEVLGFNPNNIRKIYTEDEYREVLMNKEIEAAFLEAPYVKVFLARFCDFTVASGPSFRVGGFGFAFSKNSPYLRDISEAVVKISETGKLRELEHSLTSSFNCSSKSSSTFDNYGSLDINSFLGIICISGGTSTIALFFFIFKLEFAKEVRNDQDDPQDQDQNDNNNQQH